MTSQSTSIYTPFADGRTVHDIVEHSPALVNERWCRNLLRQVLQSLEQQYASGAPHRRISPDTLVMLNNGEALLLPSSEDGAAASEDAGAATLAADLHALAMVVHYAITAELPPQGPVGPRLYDDYSDMLTQGIDRCLGPNLRLRPKTVAEMRTLLGLGADEAPAIATNAHPASPVPAPLADNAAQDGKTNLAKSAAPTDAGIARAAPPEPLFAPAQPEAPFAADPAPAPETISTLDLEPDPWAGQVADAATAASAAAMAQAQARPEQSEPPHAPLESRPIPPSAHIRNSAPAGRSTREKRTHTQHAGADSGRIQRWAMMAGAGVVLLAAGGALVAFLQQSDSRDMVPLALPPAERAANGLDKGETVVTPAAPATAGGAVEAGIAETGAAPAIMPGSGPAEVAPGMPVAVAPGVQGAAGVRADAVVNGTTYKLMIKPWGTVYVNGVDRGVSPPVKRLTLGPGTHTIRIVNPNFPEHVRTLTAGNEEGATIEHDFTAQAE